ncbi:type II secretion system protein [Virgibacillus sp. MSP4-1]|nr:type II secretion system protein [Virgibacillus sp. MSP4-1]
MINEQGVTLVEVLVSFVILSIILVSLLSFFSQSARTNQTSEEILDATYMAQTQMEQLYQLSKDYTIEQGITQLNNQNFANITTNNEQNTFHLEKPSSHFWITVEINKTEKDMDDLYNVLVKVYDQDKERLEAQMETILAWRNE